MDTCLLEMEYAGDGNRHSLRVHALACDPTPVGPFDDMYYLAPPAGPGAELTVLDSFEALGLAWAPYYPDTWTLTLLAIWAQTDSELVVLPGLPEAPTISASIAPTGLAYHSTRRTFTLYGTSQFHRRLYLSQVDGTQISPARTVMDVGGGYDSRDSDLIAYLSAPTTALRMPDGDTIRNVATVRAWWDRPLT